MDSEELAEIAFHRKNGRPETTKGPYYHKAWWESYKGAVKGIIGGIMVGGAVGAAIGGTVITALTLSEISFGGLPVAAAILASTTAFGMYEGKEKFEKVGIATGAIAAAEEVSEVRMKEYVRSKFTDLTNEIRELKAVVAGKKPAETMQTGVAAPDNAAIFDDSDFRTTHCDEHCDPKTQKFIFWNVATIGAIVGAAVATVASVAAGGEPLHQLGEFLGEIGVKGLSDTAVGAALITTGAAIGASFGISRDLFRKVFDVTDNWFLGKSHEYHAGKAQTPTIEISTTPQNTVNRAKMSDASTPSHVISNSSIAQQQTTQYRDKILAEQAKKALLSMDHTTAVRH